MYDYHVGIASAAFIAIPYPGRLVVHGSIMLINFYICSAYITDQSSVLIGPSN